MGIGRLRDIPPARTCFVSTSYVDDSSAHKFSTIQAAIDYAYSIYGPVTNFAWPIVIKIFPGVYHEQIHSYAGYHLCGQIEDWNPAQGQATVQIWNTGADAGHYPLRAEDGDTYCLKGLTINTGQDGVLGKMTDGFFNNCYLRNGHFIEATEATNKYCPFVNCVFKSVYPTTYGGFNLTGTVGSWGYRSFTDCRFYGAPVFASTHSGGTATVAFTNCYIRGHFEISGDWDIATTFGGFSSFGEASRNIIGTSGDVSITNGECVNGFHFTSAPNSLEIIGIAFIGNEDNKIPDGEADITAAVPILLAEYDNNIQHNGISGKIQFVNPTKNVGGNASNRYITVQDALDSIPASGNGTVKLYESYTGLSELVLTTSNIDVGVDGQKEYSLGFTADIVEVGANQKISFFNMVQLSGGNCELNGTSAEIGFEDCQYITGYLTLTAGAFAIIYKASFFGSTGHKAINIANTSTVMVVGYSRVQGSTGNPAVEFTVDADNKFKAKFSSFIHGDGGANSPFTYTGADKIDLAIYNSALNAAMGASDFFNTIGSPNLTISSEINF